MWLFKLVLISYGAYLVWRHSYLRRVNTRLRPLVCPVCSAAVWGTTCWQCGEPARGNNG